jgi:hypothetical protein
VTILDDVDFRIDKAQVDFLLSNHAEGEYVQARLFSIWQPLIMMNLF